MDVTRIIMDQNEIKVIVTKNFEMVSYVEGYPVYKTLWNHLTGKFLPSAGDPKTQWTNIQFVSRKKIR